MMMDSGNSGSLQSSSGGDEEYDSRATDSLFMNTLPPPHLGFISNPPPQQRPPPPLFDPLSNYMQLHQNPNSLLFNQNISWPGTTSIRSDPNPSTSHDTINPMLSIPSFQTPPASADNHHVPAAQNQYQTAARNPKKRSRASRRAPTTVLTTDTTNFRAMVQEFTGIPAQPFNNSSFSRTRLDLFGTRSTTLEPPPPFLRRPFAQKFQSPPPFLVSSTSLSSSLLGSPAIAASSAANNTNPNLFNVQNPLFSSLLQSNPKFLFSNTSVIASKPYNQTSLEIPSNDMKIGGLDEFDFGDGNHVSAALPNLISPDHTNGRNAGSWKKIGDEDEVGGNGGKRMNYSSGEKEGMLESWVCSSE